MEPESRRAGEPGRGQKPWQTISFVGAGLRPRPGSCWHGWRDSVRDRRLGYPSSPGRDGYSSPQRVDDGGAETEAGGRGGPPLRRFGDWCFRRGVGFAAGLLMLLTMALSGQGKPALLWPLAIREGITSSFGEYRRTHFHGGVDMRTHQEEGWPCFAPADGRITRLRREPGGYGRVLYLDLDDGRTIVYGHVCRFENARLHLDDALYRACERAGTSFPGDVTLVPPVHVKAGDTVCYSGELGIGTPHLHLEVRRGDEQLDPFIEGLPLPEGVGTPRIAGITFEPQDASGTVDGGFAPVFVQAVKKAEGYQLARTVSVGGAVDLFLSAGDHLGVPGNTTGVPVIEASLDGEVFSKMDLKRVSLARFKDSPALFAPDYDRPATNTYRLRKLPWITVADLTGDGLPPGLAPGPHALEVTASNRAGHQAVLRGTLARETGAVDGRLALPGTGYRLLGHEITPAGLLLTLSRTSREGVTPVSVGGQPVRTIRVAVNGRSADGKVTALIPKEELPHEGVPVMVGGVSSDFFAASGPGRISAGSVRLNLPEGSVGTAASATAASGMPPGSAARLAVGPYCLQARATVEFPGVAPRPGMGVYAGGTLFLDRWSGKAVGFRADGLYDLRLDRTPPQIGKPFLASIPHIDAPEVRFVLGDSGSGPSVRSLSVKLDGRTAFFDYDLATRTVRVDLSRFSPGKHTLAASVSDFLGNTTALPPTGFVTK